MLKAIVFDMDDTLYDEYDYVVSGFLAVDEYLQRKNIKGFYEKAIHLLQQGNNGRIFNDVLDFLKVPYEKEDIIKLINIYRGHKPSIKLFEDAEEVISILSERYPLALISDGYLIAQQNKVQALNLNNIFTEILLTDSLGRENWKPSHRPYEIIEGRLNLQGSELVYIGDNVSKDFVAAKARGWLTIHIERAEGVYKNVVSDESYHAHHKVKDLMDILPIITQYKLGSV